MESGSCFSKKNSVIFNRLPHSFSTQNYTKFERVLNDTDRVLWVYGKAGKRKTDTVFLGAIGKAGRGLWTVDADRGRGRGHGNKNYCYAHRRGLAPETKPKTLKTFA